MLFKSVKKVFTVKTVDIKLSGLPQSLYVKFDRDVHGAQRINAQ